MVPSNNLLPLQELPLNRQQLTVAMAANYRDIDYRARRQSFITRALNNNTNVNLNLSAGALDPLLLTRDNLRGNGRHIFVSDNPPSYTDVVSNLDSADFNGGEPPPPYTSTEFLNENHRMDINNTELIK